MTKFLIYPDFLRKIQGSGGEGEGICMRLTLSIATEGITIQKTTQTDHPGMNQ